MEKEKINHPFTNTQLQQLSFNYQLLEGVSIPYKKPIVCKNAVSAYHQSNNYIIQEHHKPISKIINWSDIENDGNN